MTSSMSANKTSVTRSITRIADAADTNLVVTPAIYLFFDALIAQVGVGLPPGRLEPRAPKRKPKPYPWAKGTSRRDSTPDS